MVSALGDTAPAIVRLTTAISMIGSFGSTSMGRERRRRDSSLMPYLGCTLVANCRISKTLAMLVG
jgi:hypothetical protein